MNLLNILIGNKEVRSKRWELATSHSFTFYQVAGIISCLFIFIVSAIIGKQLLGLSLCSSLAYIIVRFNL